MSLVAEEGLQSGTWPIVAMVEDEVEEEDGGSIVTTGEAEVRRLMGQAAASGERSVMAMGMRVVDGMIEVVAGNIAAAAVAGIESCPRRREVDKQNELPVWATGDIEAACPP